MSIVKSINITNPITARHNFMNLQDISNNRSHHMRNTKCMNCQSSNLKQFIDMGDQPNGNIFPTVDELEHEQIFPFAMLICNDCWQMQIEEFPSVESMFTHHPYITGINKPVVTYFEQLVNDVIQKIDLTPNSLVLDIGANDGTLLSIFRDHGMRILGIDPCNATNEIAKANGITVFKTFWDKETAEAMKNLEIYPDLIMATAVFYHVKDIHDFIKGLLLVMKENTIFCTQCIYLKDIIEKVQFDHFYHEHTMIHAISPLKNLFAQYGLRLLDVDFYPIHGGSFVLYVGKQESQLPTSRKIAETIAMEKAVGLNDLKVYNEFAERVNYNKRSLLNLLEKLRMDGKKVFGLGAPLKGNTLLNYYGIDSKLVQSITEINPLKIGRYTPGTHIPIVDERAIKKQPDYYLVLSWNFLDFFVSKYKNYLANGGKLIVPHPQVRIIDKEYLLQPENALDSSLEMKDK